MRSLKRKTFIKPSKNSSGDPSVIHHFFLKVSTDFKKIPWVLKVALLIIGFFLIWCTFFDFNHFTNPTMFPSIWTIKNNEKYTLIKQILLMINDIVAILIIGHFLLLALGKISSYFWGIIGFITYGLFSYAWGYVGDAQLFILFMVPLQLVGIKAWKDQLNSEHTIASRKINIWTWSYIFYFSAIITLIFYYEIPAFAIAIQGSYAFSGSSANVLIPHILDSITNSLSLCAFVLVMLRYREAWIIWLTVFVLQLIMYGGIAYHKFDMNMLIMWSACIVVAIFGFYNWNNNFNAYKKSLQEG